MKNFIYKTGLTHGGVFHADDVFSTALLMILNPEIEISRVYKVPEEVSADTIVYDIGLGRYDHHQDEDKSEYRYANGKKGIKYAAFGLLWRDFGHMIMSKENAERFDLEFIQPLDNSDNGGVLNPMTMAVSSYIPNWDEEDQNMDNAFWKAVNFAEDVLRRAFRRIESSEKAENKVKNALSKSDGKIVALDRFCPWETILIPSTAKFVIFPSLRGGYNAQAIPTSIGSRDQKFPFPAEWAGKPAQELQKIINGMTFCHPGRFMISTETVEQAITACKYVINNVKE